jgi:hypothetical protein
LILPDCKIVARHDGADSTIGGSEILLDINQFLGTRVGQGTKKYSIDNCKDGRGGADAESQGYDCHSGETGIPLELARGVAEVLPENLQPAESPQLAAGFFEPGDVAELTPRGVGSFVGRDALLAQLLLAHGEMKLQLVVQVAVKLPAPENQLQAQPEIVHLFAEHQTLLDGRTEPGSGQSMAVGSCRQPSAVSGQHSATAPTTLPCVLPSLARRTQGWR